jgi:hypothetical protein
VPRGSDDRIRLTAVLPLAVLLHAPASKQFGGDAASVGLNDQLSRARRLGRQSHPSGKRVL